MESLMPDLTKITKAKRTEEMVLIQVWLSAIKALSDPNSYFLDRVFYLNRDKITIFTGSKHVLCKVVVLTFFKQCVFLDIYTDNILLPR
jgi:hypothetical protein